MPLRTVGTPIEENEQGQLQQHQCENIEDLEKDLPGRVRLSGKWVLAIPPQTNGVSQQGRMGQSWPCGGLHTLWRHCGEYPKSTSSLVEAKAINRAWNPPPYRIVPPLVREPSESTASERSGRYKKCRRVFNSRLVHVEHEGLVGNTVFDQIQDFGPDQAILRVEQPSSFQRRTHVYVPSEIFKGDF